jgi:hypothetical protein
LAIVQLDNNRDDSISYNVISLNAQRNQSTLQARTVGGLADSCYVICERSALCDVSSIVVILALYSIVVIAYGQYPGIN